ncbi:hypothetical protein CPB84DRAFT_1842332 [Gymnopilus junonius]|uniref:RRM domain-containing protein n=1 Tax=Gymnopilus junonius TaxID=109634 RepID=A0A9P5P009_GYMJU|nr:hypothetical protein CPB84DRAFT_1842332 [Gymnopilus junonius]
MSNFFRQSQLIRRVTREAQHVVVRDLPISATSRDVRKMIQKAEVKGVVDVSLFYRHFRPTGKAILTMSLPEYTRDAIRDAEEIIVPGHHIEADPIDEPRSLNIPENLSDIANEDVTDPSQLGTGPAARVPERKTVTISGVPGKKSIKDIQYLLRGFRLAPDRQYPVRLIHTPMKKFTLYSAFVVFLDSESEAQRLVRSAHLTKYKNMEEAPLLRAHLIY